MHDWRVGEVYDSGGIGTWRVVRVTERRTAILAGDMMKHRTARGTVTLWNEAIGYELVAPIDDRRLSTMRLIGQAK